MFKELLSNPFVKKGKAEAMFQWGKFETNYMVTDASFKAEVEFPVGYTETAIKIITEKYFRKKPDGSLAETSLKEVGERLAETWIIPISNLVNTESFVNKKLLSHNDLNRIKEEWKYILYNQMFAPNSPQWFNTGCSPIENEEDYYMYDTSTKEVRPVRDIDKRYNISACYITGINDALLGKGSISDTLTTHTKLFKYGSGIGSNMSPLRYKGAPISKGGNSSGVMSFLKIFDVNAGSIKSGGTTRRAAMMNILNVNHPDLVEYINAKQLEEDKVKALGREGYSTQMGGEAYSTVAFQNSNFSVRFNKEFMDAYLNEKNYEFKDPFSGEDRVVNAKEVMDLVALRAWECGDPGVQFDDIINDVNSIIYNKFGELDDSLRINASNPCSEFMFLDDSACNLASINLIKFITDDGFNVDRYLHCIDLMYLVLHFSIDIAGFPTSEIAKNSYIYKPLGLGLANMTAFGMVMGHAYGDKGFLSLLGSLTQLMTLRGWVMSSKVGAITEVSQELKANRERIAETINTNFETFKSLVNYNDEYVQVSCNTPICSAIDQSLRDIQKEDTVFANAQISLLAPTGTISLAMDCITFSSEPMFALKYKKKTITGEVLEFVNPLIEDLVRKYFKGQDAIQALEYIKTKGTLYGFKNNDVHPKLLEMLKVANGTCEEDTLHYSTHLDVLEVLSPCVSGAISKTINLPTEATVETVKHVYRETYLRKIKAVTVYRNGCKIDQPLTSSAEGENKGEQPKVVNPKVPVQITNERVRPSNIRNSRIHNGNINGIKVYVTLSFYEDGNIAEVFINAGKTGNTVGGLLDDISRIISKSLQIGLPASTIAKMLRNSSYEPNGFVHGHDYIKKVTSISDFVSKVIEIELGDFTHCQVKPKVVEAVEVEDVLQMVGEDIAKTLENYSEEELRDTCKSLISSLVTGNKFVLGTHHLNAPITSIRNKDIQSSMDTPYAEKERVYGQSCSSCGGSNLVQNGTCKLCTDCGTTTGCS